MPLAEQVPLVPNSCRIGKRALNWRNDNNSNYDKDSSRSSLYWVEAQDGGDPRTDVYPRDIVYTLHINDNENSDSKHNELFATEYRFSGILFTDSGDLAIGYENWYKTRTARSWLFAPNNNKSNSTSNDKNNDNKVLLFDRNYEDSYSDPGVPLTRMNANNRAVLLTLPNNEIKNYGENNINSGLNVNRSILLAGSGASHEHGNRPFLDVFSLQTRQSIRMYESKPPHFESISSLLLPKHNNNNNNNVADNGDINITHLSVLVNRESQSENKQVFIRTYQDFMDNLNRRNSSDNTNNNSSKEVFFPFCEAQMTNFPHPYPELKNISREILRYPRERFYNYNLTTDSGNSKVLELPEVDLSANLYLPEGYDPKVWKVKEN